ncbi:MAG: D-alanyl-D-alanine carboxypeptidase [Acidimicrobiia bacterium]|nr:D-alanyl-D-alanine carboxypeptidase [Acidimicrobiia bacterium]
MKGLDGPPRALRKSWNRWTGSLSAVALLLAVTLVIPPAAAYGASAGGSAPVAQAERDRLAREFSAVLSLREASDSMCLSVMLDDELIFESRSRTSLIPASLMKVAVASAALEIIPPDEVYSTEVFARADALEAVADGVLKGDVYLIGQGDPVLSTPRFVSSFREPVAYTDITKLADYVFAALSAHDVTRIEGRLVGDESWFPHKQRDYTQEFLSGGTDPVWKRSYVTSNNAGPLSALLLNGGYRSYTPMPSGQGPRGNARAAVPAQHAASVFDDLLEARGMVITRTPVAGMAPAPGERATLGAVESPPMSEILARMLTYSDNTIAEMVLKEIGRRTGGSDRASAVAGVQDLLRRQLGPLAAGLVIADGSGLSYSNRLTCAAVAGLLTQAGPGSPVVEGLSVAGEVGTLRTCAPARLGGGDDQLNVVRAKTGTLNDVTALAGTTVAANGETITFAMIVNEPAIILLGRCNRLRRTLLNAAANYTYGPAPAGLPVHAGDHAALVALFDSTGGDAWFNAWGWKTAAPLNRWHGVATDPEGRVTGIDLSGPFGNGLTGSIPGEVGRLSELVRLDFSGNDLCVPRSIVESLPSTGVGICAGFVDTTGSSHAAALEALAGRGILDRTECAANRICPNAAIERWAMAVWLVRAIDGRDPPAVSRSSFDDVGADEWWMPYVERLAELRITKGCDTEPLRFCPDEPVSRAQTASFLVRALDLESAAPAGFGDTGGSTHEAAIDSLAAAGVTVGCQTDPPLYCPAQAVTRAQMARFLARSLGLG